MTEAALKLKILENGVAVIVLDVPDNKLNMLSRSVMLELNNILDQIQNDPAISGLVITSGKTDNFIVGANINEIRQLQNEPAVKCYEASKLGKMVFDKIENLSYKTIAALNGMSLGGGTELALACKYRIASNDPKTKIGLPEVQLGFIPGWGGTVRLPRLVGIAKALELIVGAAELPARRAWRCGLVDEVVEPAKLLARAQEIVLGSPPKRCQQPVMQEFLRFLTESNALGKEILKYATMKQVKAKTRGKYPAAIEAVKVIFKGYEQSLDHAFDNESQTFARLAVTPTAKNLVGIFFAQTESKKLPQNIRPHIKIDKVGIIGAGVMGAEIAQAAAYAGYQVVLKDIDQAALEKGKTVITDLTSALVSKRKMSQNEANQIVASIKPTLQYEDMAGCDLIIEAVVEVMKIKQSVLSDLQQVINKPFIFASNTSSLSISELAGAARNPENVVGIHFFNPVHKMKLVEIIRGRGTSGETLATAQAFAMRLGKTTVTSADAPGFIVNRILAPYLREAIILVESGVPIEDVDKALVSFGMPMGPLALLDEVGLDIAGKVIEVLYHHLGERLAPPQILSVIAEQKLLGKKGGKGIYLYENGHKTGVNPDILQAIKTVPKQKYKGEIQDRLVLVMVNEAARCLEEKIAAEPWQLDLAMVFGTGFAPFHGGILRYADRMGLAIVQQKLAYLATVSGANYTPATLLNEKARKGNNFYHDEWS